MPRSPASTLPLLFAVALATLVALLGIAVSAGLLEGFDRAVISVVRSDELRGLLSPLRAITELGATWAVTAVAVGVVVAGVAAGRSRLGIVGAVTIGLASLANTGLKRYVARERPDLLEPIVVEHGFSFPSGHSALSAVAFGMVALLVLRSGLDGRARAALVSLMMVIVFLVGLSRIYLGVHYPSDVLAGWAAGGAVVGIVAWLTQARDQPPGVDGASRGNG